MEEKILITTVDGIDIFFTALPEHSAIADHFDNEHFNIPDMEEKVNNYELVWFTAQVTAEVDGKELASEYLGGCMYSSYEKFYSEKSCYFEDMQNTVLEEAKKEIPELIKTLKQCI